MSPRLVDLWEIFAGLAQVAGSGQVYSAQFVETHSSTRVGKSQQGNPAVLFSPIGHASSVQVPAIELPNLTFRPHCTCRVHDQQGNERDEMLAVVECTSDDEMLRAYFLRTMSGLLLSLPAHPNEGEVSRAVSSLVELFRAMEEPPRRSLQGLWCELLLVTKAHDVGAAVAAWHSDPHDLLDFRAGQQAIEVKSCQGPLRQHRFLLSQLLPPKGFRTVVVSFVLEQGGRGTSLAQLWERLSGRIDLEDEARQRCSHILAAALGRDWRRANRVAFDVEAAEADMRLFDALSVPKVNPEVPAEVSRVEFTSELIQTPALSRERVAGVGGLFAATFSTQ